MYLPVQTVNTYVGFFLNTWTSYHHEKNIQCTSVCWSVQGGEFMKASRWLRGVYSIFMCHWVTRALWWTKLSRRVCLNSWVQDSGIGTSKRTLQDQDLVCGPESCRGSLDSRSLQCQWSVWKRRVKTSDENPDERRRSCEPLIWVGFIHICIFFLNSWEQCLFKTLGYFDQRSRGTTSALLLLKWCGEGNSCLCWNRLSPTSGKLRFNPKQTGSWSWLSWTFCWRKVLRKTNLHVET